ncbi:MAG: DNA polymerase III subunit chi [Methylophilaceae bacterium]
MTRIIFYSNLLDKQMALLTLVQKALAKKHQITILVNDKKGVNDLSRVLWQNDLTSFLPNVLASSELAEQTPIILDWQEKQLCQDDILINLTQKQLTIFSRFRQLVELVDNDEQDKVLARQRFKFYRDRGYEVRHFDQENLIN